MTKYTEYDKYNSGRQAVFRFLDENPRHSFASLKNKLLKETGFGSLKDQTIRNYMSEWRGSYSHFGAGPRLHRGFGVLMSGFDVGLWEVAPSFGWRVSRNKNHERLWNESDVSLGWHRNGTVTFRFKGLRPEGHLLAAFVHAFREALLSTGRREREVVDHLHGLFKKGYRTRGFHSTYETSQLLPRLTIRDFKKSHGITLKLGDRSHPTSLEVEQGEPFWFSRIDKIVNQLGVQIESHLDLVKLWREESLANRRALNKSYQMLKQQQEKFDRLVSRLLGFLQQSKKENISNE